MDTIRIKILGETWTIKEERLPDEIDAQTEYTKRRIVFDPKMKKYPKTEYNRTIRHEIIHAFQFESGLGFNVEHKPIGVEETFVDWYALQYPKIKKIYEKLDVEE